MTPPQRPRTRRTGQESAQGPSGAVQAISVTSSTGGAHNRASVDSDGVRAVLLDAMSEREFQKHVRESLEARGWLCFVIPDMRRTRAGWPDILAVLPGHPCLLAWELKTQTGHVRPDQETVLIALSDVPGVDARIVRPRDWLWLKEIV